MSDEQQRTQAYGAAWRELRIRHCIREAAMVAHLYKRNQLRDEFVIAAGQIFDEVADDIERMARERPDWPSEFAVAVAVAVPSEHGLTVTVTGATKATP
jgi:hypothetical protein